uniref:Magnetosome protein MamL n=1 Tax=delta proteobacterium ML-1 TaxID=947513 RepID=U5IGM7_9DELT|nr:magnetosome protein MamL [delta proteobacterium ML-1]
MFKTILTVAITVFMVLFALNNFDRVTVHLLIGKSVDMRLIFVILLAALAGYLLRHFIGITREEELKRRLLLERKKRFQRKSQPNLDDEFDL